MNQNSYLRAQQRLRRCPQPLSRRSAELKDTCFKHWHYNKLNAHTIFMSCLNFILFSMNMKGPQRPAVPYLLQGGIRYSIAGYPQVGKSVIQLVEELYKGSVFSGLVGQDIGDFMANVLNQTCLVDMLEYQVGDEGHVCSERGRKRER